MNTGELPAYRISNLLPIEDDQGNLIDIQLELEPSNMVAEVFDIETEDDSGIPLGNMSVEMTIEVIEQIEKIKESYGERNLISEEE